jgi:HAD superfamily hydrolase (TIGR01490 family)
VIIPEYFAFFDVDETLISGKSMFMFSEYCCEQLGTADAARKRQEIAALRIDAQHLGMSRTAVNLEYYRRLLRGWSVAEVMRLGESWFSESHGRPGFFVEAAIRHAYLHKRRGGQVVLVSGSFEAPLAPIARHVGASYILATRLGVDDGIFNGSVLRGCIGNEKAQAVSLFLKDNAVCPSHCYAYGDHLSDADMLASVGHPIVVGSDQALLKEARRRKWLTISACSLESN